MKKYIFSKIPLLFFVSIVLLGTMWSCEDDEGFDYEKKKTPPSIVKLPAYAQPGDTISITGYNMTSDIYIGEIDASNYSVTLNGEELSITAISSVSGNPSILELQVAIPATYVLGDHILKVGVNGVVSDDYPFTVANVLLIPLSDGNDDVEEGPEGDMSFTSSDLELAEAETGKGLQVVGIRFNDILLASDAVVKFANIQFTCDKDGSGEAQMTIYGENIGDSPAFADVAFDVSNRTKTTANTVWDIPEWREVGDAGDDQKTEDFAPIVQEIIDRVDWTSGNSMSFIFVSSGPSVDQGSTSAGREAEAGTGSDSAHLTIVYI